MPKDTAGSTTPTQDAIHKESLEAVKDNNSIIPHLPDKTERFAREVRAPDNPSSLVSGSWRWCDFD